MEIITGYLLSGEILEIEDAGLDREKIEMIEIIMGALPQLLGEKKKIFHAQLKQIMDKLVIMDFDESLLLWHIATDICLLQVVEGPPTKSMAGKRHMSKTLSEYMMYLLIKQPEMLSGKTGIWLMRYQDTCADARRFFSSRDAWIEESGNARKALLGVNTSQPPALVMGTESSKSVLLDACILAKFLWRLENEELMIDVLVGVWVEMLMYAARKCPGSTHVRQLNRGGELITLIWFLIEHMGLGERCDESDGGPMAKIIVHDQ